MKEFKHKIVSNKREYETANDQHLYILSNEHLTLGKIGDYYLHMKFKKIHKKKSMTWQNHFDDMWYKKVIASTDKSLKLPTISNSFFKEYYEKGGVDEVLVEYVDNGSEEWIGDDYNGEPFWNEKLETYITEDNYIKVKVI